MPQDGASRATQLDAQAPAVGRIAPLQLSRLHLVSMRRLVGCDRGTSIDRPQGHIYGGSRSQRAPLVALQSGEQIWNQMRNRVSQYKSQITRTHVHVRSIACTPHAHPRASTSALRWSGGPDTVTRTELFCTRNVVIYLERRPSPRCSEGDSMRVRRTVLYRRAQAYASSAYSTVERKRIQERREVLSPAVFDSRLL